MDTFRQHQTEGCYFSWWDYRGGSWQKNDGLRIDFVLATNPLSARCTGAGIDKDERKPPKKPAEGEPAAYHIDGYHQTDLKVVYRFDRLLR